MAEVIKERICPQCSETMDTLNKNGVKECPDCWHVEDNICPKCGAELYSKLIRDEFITMCVEECGYYEA